jgi:hypothetical protein
MLGFGFAKGRCQHAHTYLFPMAFFLRAPCLTRTGRPPLAVAPPASCRRGIFCYPLSCSLVVFCKSCFEEQVHGVEIGLQQVTFAPRFNATWVVMAVVSEIEHVSKLLESFLFVESARSAMRQVAYPLRPVSQIGFNPRHCSIFAQATTTVIPNLGAAGCVLDRELTTTNNMRVSVKRIKSF